jgi:hypothetical protein
VEMRSNVIIWKASMSNEPLDDAAQSNDVCLEWSPGKSTDESFIADTKNALDPSHLTTNQQVNSLPRRGRVSKRVRSQLMTTEKQTERKSNRSSVEYCLLAGVLSCTAQNPYYAKMLKRDICWEDLPTIRKYLPTLSSQALVEGRSLNRSLNAENHAPTNFFPSPTSLNGFILQWSRHNSGPQHLLENFLITISFHIVEVFSGETIDLLSTCVIDCKSMS